MSAGATYGDGADHPSYWPPFYDPTIPTVENGLPPAILRPVTTVLGPDQIGTVMMPVPLYYL